MTAAADLDVYGRLIEAYEAEVPARRSPARVYEHARRLRALEEWLAPRGLTDASPADLRAWLRSLHLNDRSTRAYGGTLFDFYDWAAKRRLVAANPAGSMRRVRPLWQLAPVAESDPAPTTLDEAIRAYVWDRRGRGEITERSAQVLADRLRILANTVGADLPIGALDRRAVLRFQHAVGGHAPASRRAYLSTVRTFARWAIAEGLIGADRPPGSPRYASPAGYPERSARTRSPPCSGSQPRTGGTWRWSGCWSAAGCAASRSPGPSWPTTTPGRPRCSCRAKPVTNGSCPYRPRSPRRSTPTWLASAGGPGLCYERTGGPASAATSTSKPRPSPRGPPC